MEEYFDVVDKQNRLTGERIARKEAHATGVWHRAVHAYFYRIGKNKSIEFLVHLRSKDKDMSPNCWDTRFGGHVASGQTVEEAIVDEIKDETGLSVTHDMLTDAGWTTTEKYPNNEFNRVYYYNFTGGLDDLHFSDGEVQEVKWMQAGEICASMEKEPKRWSGRLSTFSKTITWLEAKLAEDLNR